MKQNDMVIKSVKLNLFDNQLNSVKCNKRFKSRLGYQKKEKKPLINCYAVG